ncbi:MAG: response regulator [Actinomycetota bacterium]
MSPVPTPRPQPRVLLVDDSMDSRQALRELLEVEGIAVVGEAGDGASGIELAQELAPDVVLMDVKMPGIGGIQATEIIVGRLPATRVVMLSTFDDELRKRQALQAGATAYVVKGGSMHDIADAVLNAVGSKEE